MTYFLCFLALAILWFFTSCKKDQGTKKSKETDLKQFNNGFSNQKDTIYFHDVALENVDPPTFKILDDYFFKDKDHVYLYQSYRISQDYFTTKRKKVLLLENADPSSFVVLGDGYARDNYTAWYLNVSFKVDDLESLMVLNHHFVKDKITAYIDRRPIDGSDGKTFELVSDYYAKDSKKHYYCTPINGEYEIKTISCQHESFVIIDHQYSKDNTNVFYEGDKLLKAESSTFDLITSGYAKDSRNVYFRNNIVEKADPSSFTTFAENENSMGETVYARDKNGIYVNEKHFAGVDEGTFKILNEKYTIDKNGVYYLMKKVKDADLSSFKVYPHFMGDADAEDKNKRYGEGKLVLRPDKKLN